MGREPSCNADFDAIESPIRREVAEIISTGRVARGLTRDQLADRVGISIGAIANMENGRVDPRMEMAGWALEAVGYRLVIEPIEAGPK